MSIGEGVLGTDFCSSSDFTLFGYRYNGGVCDRRRAVRGHFWSDAPQARRIRRTCGSCIPGKVSFVRKQLHDANFRSAKLG